MSTFDTVWDLEPDARTPNVDPVSGKLDRPDSAGPRLDLGVFADIAIHLGGLVRQEERRQAKANMVPGDYQYATAAAYPASGSLALDLGSPAVGTWWQIRRIVIGGSDISTSPAGVGWVFIQGANPIANGATPSIAQVADFTTATFPQRGPWGTHQLVAEQGEHVWIVITGGTPGTQYVASVKCETFDRAAGTSATYQE